LSRTRSTTRDRYQGRLIVPPDLACHPAQILAQIIPFGRGVDGIRLDAWAHIGGSARVNQEQD
jgi:hypothetical protein